MALIPYHLHLAALIALVAALLPAEVAAQGLARAPAQVVLRPMGELLVPGQVQPLTAYVLGEGGRPLVGAALEATVDALPAPVEEGPPGVYRVEVRVPPTSETRATVRVAVKGSAAAAEVELPVRPERIPPLPVEVVLPSGEVGPSGVDLVVDTRLPGWRSPRPEAVRFFASVGSVGPARPDGEGRLRAHFTPPEGEAPRVALIVAAVGEGAHFRWGWTSVVLPGKRTVTVETEPWATAWAEVGGRTFGPARADSKGSVTFQLVVPPGVEGVVIRARTPDGATVRSTLPLGPPPFPRALIVPSRQDADPARGVELVVVAVQPGGEPLPLSGEVMLADLPGLQGGVAPTPGVWEGRYVPQGFTPGGEVRLRLADSTLMASPQILALRGRRPETLQIEAPCAQLRVDEPACPVELRSLDASGQPAAGGRFEVEVSAGRVGAPEQVGVGRVIAPLEPPALLSELPPDEAGRRQITLTGRLYLEPGGDPAASLRLWPPRTLMDPGLWPNGLPIPFRVVDARGLPAKGWTVQGEVRGAAGVVVGGVSDERGWGEVHFRPDPGARGAVFLSLWVADTALPAQELLLVVSPGGDEGFELPDEARPTQADATARRSFLVREGSVRQVLVSVQPSIVYVDAGDQAQIRVRLIDSRGNEVVRPDLQIDADAGAISAVSVDQGVMVATWSPGEGDLPDGIVHVRVRAPDDEFVGGSELVLKRHTGDLSLGLGVAGATDFGNIQLVGAQATGQWAVPRTGRHVFARADVWWVQGSMESELPTEGGGTVLLSQAYRYNLTSVGVVFKGRPRSLLPYAGGCLAFGLVRSTSEVGDEGGTTVADREMLTGFMPYVGVQYNVGQGALFAELSHFDLDTNSLEAGLSGDVGAYSLSVGYQVYLF